MIVRMNPTPPNGIRRIAPPARAALLLVGAALLAGCGSTQVSGAGGGAPGPVGATGGRTSAKATAPDTPSSAALPTPTPVPAPTCSPEGVSLAAEEANAAMGLRVMAIRLTNCGAAPYTLNGRPGVRVLDADRAPLDIAVQKGSAGIATLEGFDAAPTAVTLRPGEYAAFQLVWRNTVTSGTKGADNGRFLEIAPLPGRPPVVVPAYLDLGTTGRLGISAWAEATAAARLGNDRPGAPPAR
ncbi:DUF4232 domain-containing protein [Kitasatospora sp. NPDC086009]|uniref:DUF4232 domain-containing protein n=1 Tax=unclassified Kitasatospora TaxID=2633591 RepID=UPI0037C5A8F8